MIELKTADLVDPFVAMGELAMAFSQVNRITYLPDGSPESDTDHTVMLGWLACALAAKLYPDLDLGMIAQYALVHDAPEVFAGDTPTLRITASELMAKADREHRAVEEIRGMFVDSLPWFPATIMGYEKQYRPEARFVRGVDKILPKITHLFDGGKCLAEDGMTASDLRKRLNDQRHDMTTYIGEFPRILTLHCLLSDRVCALLAEQEEAD